MNKNLKLGLLVIYSCGGHARSVADVAISIGYTDIVFIDENARDKENVLEFPVFKALDGLECVGASAIAAHGDNSARRLLNLRAEHAGLTLVSIISDEATVSPSSSIEPGVFIAHGAHIGPRTQISKGAIINTSAVVEHDCQIGEYTHISVNATVCGAAKIGENCMIGAGSIVVDSVRVTGHAILGAGGCLIKSISERGTYVGVPARKSNN